MTNVHHLHNSTPSLRAIDALKTVLAGGASVRDGWLAYGAALNEIKAQYPGKAGDGPFGAAVSAAGLDVWPEGGSAKLADPIKSHVRSAAMWAAALTTAELDKYEAAHSIEVSIKGGFRGLHAKVTEAAKPAATIPPPSPSVSKVLEEVTPAIEAGEAVNVRDVAAKLGVGRATVDYGVQRATGRVEGRAEVRAEEPIIDVSTLSMSAQEKLEAAKRQALKVMENEYTSRVSQGVREHIEKVILPLYKAEIDEAERIRVAHKGFMTKQEHKLILSCLHPDARLSTSDEKLNEAFRIFNSRTWAFLPGTETAPSLPPIPSTLAEMMQRKQEYEAQKKAAKAAKKAKE